MTALLILTAVKGTALLAVAWLVAFALRKGSAAVRHLVWTSALAALLLLPLVSLSVPVFPVAVTGGGLLAPVLVIENVAGAPWGGRAKGVATKTAGVETTPVSGFDFAWPQILAWLWAAGTGLFLLQMVVASLALKRARRKATPVTDEAATELAERVGIRRPVVVLETAAGTMPMTSGILKPAVFLPAGASEWSAERRHIVLLHELAHIERGDLTTHILARAALSVYWWNPLAWIAWREFLKERERAADDLVLGLGARASEYAAHLLEIARTMQTPASVGSAALAMARRSQLEGRLMAILDSGLNRKRSTRLNIWISALAAVAIVFPMAAVRAQEKGASTPRFRSQASTETPLNEQQYQHQKQTLEEKLKVMEKSAGGERGVDIGKVLARLADIDREVGNDANAAALYKRAAEAIGDRAEAVYPLTRLGIVAFLNKDYEGAATFLDRARVLDPVHASQAMMWTALTHQRLNRTAEAEATFRATLAVQDPSSPEAATTMELFAMFLREQKRGEEAAAMEASASANRRSQEGHGAPRGDRPGVYRIGGGIEAPRLVHKVEPKYTDEARAAKYQGTAVFYTEIDEQGIPRTIRIVRSLGLGLDEKGIESISQWKFSPGTKDGQAVRVAATIEVNFRLM